MPIIVESRKRDRTSDAEESNPCRKRVGQNADSQSSLEVQPKVTRAEDIADPFILTEPPVVGKSQLHRSHTLETCAGIILCTRCGFYCIHLASSLALPCRNKLSKTGHYNIARWCKGHTAAPKVQWPDPSPAAAVRRVIWRSSV